MEARGAPRAGSRKGAVGVAAPGRRGLVPRDKPEYRGVDPRRLNASIRPVLKHGPRSLTRMRAGGRQTHEAQAT